MTVLILTACPPGLRGQVGRWLQEVAPGVFVGRVTSRVRDLLWERALEDMAGGRGLLIYPAANEQRFAVRSFGHQWRPVDFDGVMLFLHPNA